MIRYSQAQVAYCIQYSRLGVKLDEIQDRMKSVGLRRRVPLRRRGDDQHMADGVYSSLASISS